MSFYETQLISNKPQEFVAILETYQSRPTINFVTKNGVVSKSVRYFPLPLPEYDQRPDKICSCCGQNNKLQADTSYTIETIPTQIRQQINIPFTVSMENIYYLCIDCLKQMNIVAENLVTENATKLVTEFI